MDASLALSPIDRMRSDYADELVAAGLLIRSGVDGVYGRSGTFERIVDGIAGLIATRSAGDRADVVRFPPVVTRANFVKSGHLTSFPTLSGSVHSFDGDDAAHKELLHKVDSGEDWSTCLHPTDLVLTPAACYPVYPTVAGTLPEGGRTFDVMSYCFRNEPSIDPMRMQLFRQQEHVRIGEPDHVEEWRTNWFQRAQEIYSDLRVPFSAEIANDPFFGRTGRLLARNQRQQALKFEVLIPIMDGEHPTACASLNSHQEHFGHLFGIRTADGNDAHTACIGFGLERTTLAMLRFHGLDPARWPADVRGHLEL
jgi:seryl-tRNA synthetase